MDIMYKLKKTDTAKIGIKIVLYMVIKGWYNIIWGGGIMSPKSPENSERINVFFSPAVLDHLKAKAAKRGMTVSGLVRMVMMEWLKKNDSCKEGWDGMMFLIISIIALIVSIVGAILNAEK